MEELSFPIEFIVEGTPVSIQAHNADAKIEWKEKVRDASRQVIPEEYFSTDKQVEVTLFYFASAPIPGDVDNIIKLVLDALSQHIYRDDRQVVRVVAQKFEPENVFSFSDPSLKLQEAIARAKPLLYVRINDRPFEDLQ